MQAPLASVQQPAQYFFPQQLQQPGFAGVQQQQYVQYQVNIMTLRIIL